MKYEELTGQIIKCFYTVYEKLGYGFLEKIYERALMIEFKKAGLNFNNQYPINVYYDDENIGDFVADFLLVEKVIVEIKAVKHLTNDHESQLLNYLNATNIEVGLLLNFGEKPEIKRKVYDNELKKYKAKEKNARG